VSVFELAGSAPAVPGVAAGKVCDACDGEGELETEAREIIKCHVCKGTGGTDAEAVAKARRFSAAYFKV